MSGWGHATLLHMEPSANTRLNDPPSGVRLSFNERVERVFNSIRVVDSRGKRVDRGESRVVGEGDTLEVPLDPLAEGPYTVIWRINSVDGHQVQGHYGFGVRADPPDEKNLAHLLATDRGPFWRFYLPVVKWAGMAGMVLWLGGLSFWHTVFAPALSPDANREPPNDAFTRSAARRSLRILWAGAIVFLVAESLALVGQAVTFTDMPLIQAIAPSMLATVLATTSYGQWFSIRMLGAGGLLGLCLWRMRLASLASGENRLLLRKAPLVSGGYGVLSGLILVTLPLNGHARAVPQAAYLAVGSDWAHLIASTAWIGGLVHFWAVTLFVDAAGGGSIPSLARIARRFSRLAQISVAVLVASGIYNAWLHLPAWAAFLSTDYGRVLLAKLLLLIPILLIAVVNRRRVLPALDGFANAPGAARDWAGRFRKLLAAETVLGLVVLALAASLTSLPPAATVVAAGPLSLSRRSAEMTVGLHLDPNRVGINQARVTLQNVQGLVAADARRVTLYVRSLDMDMGLETIQAQAVPDGSYRADVTLSMAGRWQVSVEVSPAHGDIFVTEFQVSPTL